MIINLLTSRRGITDCSKPQQFYWFNPVKVLVSELLAGAQIALPSQVITILKLLRIGSQIMYGFFMAGTIVNFILVFMTPLVLRTRWFSLALALLGFLAALLVTVAAVIATVITVVARIALTAQDDLNIRCEIGVKMFVFMWIAAGFTLLAFFLHAGMGCCCKPQRREKAGESTVSSDGEKSQRIQLPSFVRRRRGAASTV